MPTLFPAAISLSLSDLTVLPQATSANVYIVAMIQTVETSVANSAMSILWIGRLRLGNRWFLLGRSSRRTAIDRHDKRDVEFYQARQKRRWESIVLISKVTGKVPREVDCESATWYSLDDCLKCYCVRCEERIGLRDLLWNRIAVSIGNGQVVRGISGGLIRVLESLAS